MENETQQNQVEQDESQISSQHTENSYGALVGSIIIIFIVIAGGIYYFKSARKDISTPPVSQIEGDELEVNQDDVVDENNSTSTDEAERELQ